MPAATEDGERARGRRGGQLRITGVLSASSAGMAAGLMALLLVASRRPAWLLLPPRPPAPATGDLGNAAQEAQPAANAPAGTAPGAPPPAGSELPAGSAAPAAEPSDAACPADMALVEGSFCPVLPYNCEAFADAAEYRCAQYARGQRCLRPADPRRYCIDRHEWPNRLGAQPQVFVSWHQAKEACTSVDKRLCRRSEWVLACEGPKRLPYPWGYRRRPSPCNIDRPSIPFDVNAMMRPSTREGELARLWQADPIGSHPDCVSAFGVYDLAGNVDEWTDNELDDPQTKRPSTLNGGYWGPVRDTCRLTTKKHRPNFRFYQVGFRCCRDPLSGSMPAPQPWAEPGDRDEQEDD